MQMILNREESGMQTSEEGNAYEMVVWHSVDSHYKVLGLRRPEIKLYRAGVMDLDKDNAGTFKLGFQTDHSVTSQVVFNDLVLQMRKLHKTADADEVYSMLIALGSAYNVNMHTYRDYKALTRVEYVTVRTDNVAGRFTRWPRILQVVDHINARKK